MEEKCSIYFILLLISAVRNNKKKETLQCSRGLLAHRGIDTTSGKVSSFVRFYFYVQNPFVAECTPMLKLMIYNKRTFFSSANYCKY
jgi:hypothetical protein